MKQEHSAAGIKSLKYFIKAMNVGTEDPSAQVKGRPEDALQVVTPELIRGIKVCFLQTTYKGERVPDKGGHPTSHEDLIIRAALTAMPVGQPFVVITVKAEEKTAIKSIYSPKVSFYASLCQVENRASKENKAWLVRVYTLKVREREISDRADRIPGGITHPSRTNERNFISEWNLKERYEDRGFRVIQAMLINDSKVYQNYEIITGDGDRDFQLKEIKPFNVEY